jgi:hypothetical protein
LVGNLIDRLSRNLQDRQTIGLPVGPDTSRLIAELVGAAIDVEIQKKLNSVEGRGIRFVDDFTLGCSDRAEAEKAIAVIRKAANLFELDLNSEKTSINGVRAAPPGGWKVFIRSIVPKPPFTPASMEIFVFRVAELARQLPDVNVEKFAIQNARRTFVECESWKIAENYLISVYKENSTVIDIMVEIFILRHQSKGDVSLKSVASFIETRLPLLCDQRRIGEASWLLFMAIALDLRIKARSVEGFFGEDDSLSAVLIGDASAKAIIEGKMDFSGWNKHLTTESLDGEMWLYAYETTSKSLNGSAAGDRFIKTHRYFSALSDKKIEFYRSGQGIVGMARVLHRRKLGKCGRTSRRGRLQ